MLGYVKHYQKVITISNCGNTILYFKTVNDTIPSYAKINFKNVLYINVIKNTVKRIQLSIIQYFTLL